MDGSNTGILALGLSDQCFIYGKSICREIANSLSFQEPTCLKFNENGAILIITDSKGTTKLIDMEKMKKCRSYRVHTSRIGCIENTENWGFLTGSKDTSIVHNDIRVKDPKVLTILAHKVEVCGLANQNGTVASSGNDGRINIWDLRKSNQFQGLKLFTGGVKAIQWCPWKVGQLVAGGGCKDHKILFWNLGTGEVDRTFEAYSQVTALRLREGPKDLVTTHSKGIALIWDLERGRQKKVLRGHRGRVLGLAEPRGEGLWTMGADETLRCWGSNDQESSIRSRSSEPKI